MRCPHCHQSYEGSEVNVTEADDTHLMVEITCAVCGTAHHFATRPGTEPFWPGSH